MTMVNRQPASRWTNIGTAYCTPTVLPSEKIHVLVVCDVVPAKERVDLAPLLEAMLFDVGSTLGVSWSALTHPTVLGATDVTPMPVPRAPLIPLWKLRQRTLLATVNTFPERYTRFAVDTGSFVVGSKCSPWFFPITAPAPFG